MIPLLRFLLVVGGAAAGWYLGDAHVVPILVGAFIGYIFSEFLFEDDTRNRRN
jgi:hypothetical protein